MKIYATPNQLDSDKVYVLQELIKLSDLKNDVKGHNMEIFHYDADDSDYGLVMQTGSHELEFYKYDLKNMEQINQ